MATIGHEDLLLFIIILIFYYFLLSIETLLNLFFDKIIFFFNFSKFYYGKGQVGHHIFIFQPFEFPRV